MEVKQFCYAVNSACFYVPKTRVHEKCPMVRFLTLRQTTFLFRMNGFAVLLKDADYFYEGKSSNKLELFKRNTLENDINNERNMFKFCNVVVFILDDIF